VVSTQFGSILDAIKIRKKEFIFEGEEISLVPTCGCFITMNPGYSCFIKSLVYSNNECFRYKGRSELPENLKALFRPMSMVNPDIALICEILLFSEGFKSAKVLSKKVVSLYKLSKELLSKQDHYDWGLRALKSLLVHAGSLKRAEPEIPEEHILMRALRDFNKPKIVADDSEVFLGLVSDLFPDVQLPRKVDKAFEETIKTSAVQLGLQPEDNFILKVVQFHELLGIRHSVFILGPAGSGKSCTWKTLVKTYSNLGNKTMVHILNPKSVTTSELFGSIHPVSRDWKDGLFSNIMRDLAYNPSPDRKWILMDGDIDPVSCTIS
jgi:dynein heavy chain